MLDFHEGLSHSLAMDFPTLRQALTEHFGDESWIGSPEDETEAWKEIVRECRDGGYGGLVQEMERLLTHSDQEIFEFLRSCAPAWECHSPEEARRGLTVFHSYVETYSE